MNGRAGDASDSSSDDDVYSDALEDVEGRYIGAAEDEKRRNYDEATGEVGGSTRRVRGGAVDERVRHPGDVNVRSANRPKIRSVESAERRAYKPVCSRCCFALLHVHLIHDFGFCLCHRDRAGSVRESHRGDIGAQRVGKCGVDAHLGREFYRDTVPRWRMSPAT